MELQRIHDGTNHLTKVTPFSKAFAAILFIIMPFVGLYIGYTYAPEKVIEVESVAVQNVESVIEDPYSPGESFQGYTVSSITKSKVNSTVSLVFTDPASRKLTGTVQAYYSFYVGEYTLQFTPDNEYPLPLLPGFETPTEFSLINATGDLTAEINNLCGNECVPPPNAEFAEIEAFDRQNYEWEVVVTPVYVTYEYYNAGAGTRGSYITISDVQRK